MHNRGMNNRSSMNNRCSMHNRGMNNRSSMNNRGMMNNRGSMDNRSMVNNRGMISRSMVGRGMIGRSRKSSRCMNSSYRLLISISISMNTLGGSMGLAADSIMNSTMGLVDSMAD